MTLLSHPKRVETIHSKAELNQSTSSLAYGYLDVFSVLCDYQTKIVKRIEDILDCHLAWVAVFWTELRLATMPFRRLALSLGGQST
jgi:hypothetical protein